MSEAFQLGRVLEDYRSHRWEKALNESLSAVEKEKKEEKGEVFEVIWRCYHKLGKKSESVYWALRAYSAFPSRAESLVHLARTFIDMEDYETAKIFADLGEKLQLPETEIEEKGNKISSKIFFDPDAYRYRSTFYKSVLLFYSQPEAVQKGIQACDRLLLRQGTQAVHPKDLHRTKNNLKYYVIRRPLQEAKRVTEIVPPRSVSQIWRPLNPSLVMVATEQQQQRGKDRERKILINVRVINCSWVEKTGELRTVSTPRRLITFNNPVVSSNFLTEFDPVTLKPSWKEGAIPLAYEEALYRSCCTFEPSCSKGIEDLRLFTYKDRVYFLGTSVEVHPGGANKMLFGVLSEDYTEVAAVSRLSSPKGESWTEKNWTPFVFKGQPICFYNLQTVYRLDPVCLTCEIFPVPYRRFDYRTEYIQNLRGSAPPVEAEGHLYFFVHERLEDQYSKIYIQRILLLDPETLEIRRISEPFRLRGENNIEYLTGVVYFEKRKLFLLSWGEEDVSAFVCDLDYEAVRDLTENPNRSTSVKCHSFLP